MLSPEYSTLKSTVLLTLLCLPFSYFSTASIVLVSPYYVLLCCDFFKDAVSLKVGY